MCKHIVGERLKGSERRWRFKNDNAIATLRSAWENGEADQFFTRRNWTDIEKLDSLRIPKSAPGRSPPTPDAVWPVVANKCVTHTWKLPCHWSQSFDLGSAMNRHERLLRKILIGRSDTNIRFDELRTLMQYLGFEERIRGSHHIYRKRGVLEKVNLQRDDGTAKPYQVRQLRQLALRYQLGGAE